LSYGCAGQDYQSCRQQSTPRDAQSARDAASVLKHNRPSSRIPKIYHRPKAMRAKHRPRAQLRQCAQLAGHKFFERVVGH